MHEGESSITLIDSLNLVKRRIHDLVIVDFSDFNNATTDGCLLTGLSFMQAMLTLIKFKMKQSSKKSRCYGLSL